MFSFSAGTPAKSAEVNQNFSDLANDAGDTTANSLELLRRMTLDSFVYSGMTLSTSANLNSTLAAGVAIINGKYVTTSATILTFSASKDTYLDIKDDGTFVQVPVANNATTGMTITANSDGSKALRIALVVTSGTAITGVSQAGFDPLGNIIYPTSSAGAVKIYTPTTSNVSGGSVTSASGLYGKIGPFKFAIARVGFAMTGATSHVTASFPTNHMGAVVAYLNSISTVGNSANQYISGDGYNPTNASFYTAGGANGSGYTATLLLLGF